MKAGVEHRVPLSGQALDVLGKASALRDESGLVFPSPLRPDSPMSDMTLTAGPPFNGPGGESHRARVP